VGAVTAHPGFLSRKEVAAAYAAASGRDLRADRLLPGARADQARGDLEGILKRFQLGHTAGAGFEKIDTGPPSRWPSGRSRSPTRPDDRRLHVA
jgi:hypothetical protein